MKEFNFHVKPVGLFDMLQFKKLVPRRAKRLAEGSAEPVTAVYPVNRLAAHRHPKAQQVTITEVMEHGDIAKTYILSGEALAPFRAGQYLSVHLTIGESVLTRPYSDLQLSGVGKGRQICDHSQTRCGRVCASEWILSNWKAGTKLTVSGPEGTFYYEPLRDEKHVCRHCGRAAGSRLSFRWPMPSATASRDFSLTILYGSCREQDILFRKELG